MTKKYLVCNEEDNEYIIVSDLLLDTVKANFSTKHDSMIVFELANPKYYHLGFVECKPEEVYK
jgi:hypothetical protein